MGCLRRVRRRAADDRGVTAVEYGLIVALVALIAIPSIVFLTNSLRATHDATLESNGVYECVGADCSGAVDAAYAGLGDDAVPEPVTPSVPSVTTNPATSITSSAATLSASVNANNAATSITIRVDSSEDTVNGGGGALVTISPSSATGTASTGVSGSAVGLQPETTYYFRASATNSVGTTTGSTLSFTTQPIVPAAPTVTTGAASGVTDDGATLSATVNANNAVTTALSIRYGTNQTVVDNGGGTDASISPTSVSGNTDTAVSASVTDLQPNTVYYYRASATNTVARTDGTTRSFTTESGTPTVVTAAASSVTANTATLNGSVTANGAAVDVEFCHSTTNDAGACAPWSGGSPGTASGTSAISVSRAVTVLQAGTTYYFWVRAVRGTDTVTSSFRSFTTSTNACPTGTVLAPRTLLVKNADVAVLDVSKGFPVTNASITSASPTSGNTYVQATTNNTILKWKWADGVQSPQTLSVIFEYTSTQCTGTGSANVVFTTAAS